MGSTSSRPERPANFQRYEPDFVSDWFSVEDLLSQGLLEKGDLIEMHHYSIRNQWGIFYDDGENMIAHFSGVWAPNRRVYGTDLRIVAAEKPYTVEWCRINNGEDTKYDNTTSGTEIAEKAKNSVGFQPRNALLWTSYHFAKTFRYGSAYYDVAAKAFRLDATNVGYGGRWQTIEELESELCEGDLVEISRAGGIYSVQFSSSMYLGLNKRDYLKHWGIAKKDEENKDKESWQLIHLTKGKGAKKGSIECIDIRKVVESSRCRINNEFDLYREVGNISDIIQEGLDECEQGETDYHLVIANCEYFVKKIRNGDGVTKQGIWLNFAFGAFRQLLAMGGGLAALLVLMLTEFVEVTIPVGVGILVASLIANCLVYFSPGLLSKYPKLKWIKSPAETIKELIKLTKFKGSKEKRQPEAIEA